MILDGYETDLLLVLSRTEKDLEIDKFKRGYQLRLVIKKHIEGNAENPFQAQILSCGSEIPNPMMHGIFFVEKASKRVIPIYEHQGEIYSKSITELAKRTH